MTTNAAWIRVDPERAGDTLRQEAVEKINSGEREVTLDFGAVLRIDVDMVQALEQLAGLADARSAAVQLRAVNADIYRVLKQLKLAQQFAFPA